MGSDGRERVKNMKINRKCLAEVETGLGTNGEEVEGTRLAQSPYLLNAENFVSWLRDDF